MIPKNDPPAKLDPLYETAKQLIFDTKNSTISLAQRRLLINYTRAVGLIEAFRSGGRRVQRHAPVHRQSTFKPPWCAHR